MISCLCLPLNMLNMLVPTIGPISHPRPPQPIVMKPMVMNGSRGIWVTNRSSSAVMITWAPAAEPNKPVPMEEPSCHLRRTLRSLKNEFQSRGGESGSVAFCAVDFCATASDFDGDVEKCRTRGRWMAAGFLVVRVNGRDDSIALGDLEVICGSRAGCTRRETAACRSDGAEDIIFAIEEASQRANGERRGASLRWRASKFKVGAARTTQH